MHSAGVSRQESESSRSRRQGPRRLADMHSAGVSRRVSVRVRVVLGRSPSRHGHGGRGRDDSLICTPPESLGRSPSRHGHGGRGRDSLICTPPESHGGCQCAFRLFLAGVRVVTVTAAGAATRLYALRVSQRAARRWSGRLGPAAAVQPESRWSRCSRRPRLAMVGYVSSAPLGPTAACVQPEGSRCCRHPKILGSCPAGATAPAARCRRDGRPGPRAAEDQRRLCGRPPVSAGLGGEKSGTVMKY
jgi:hypothetical protein